MAAPSYVGFGVYASNTAAAVSFTWGAHAAGDIGLLVIETSGADPTLTPSGWTHVTGSPLVDVASAAGSKLHVLWKRAASASEAAASVTATDHAGGRIFVFRGVPTAVTPPFNGVASAVKTTASTSITYPSVTTTTADTRIVLIASRPNDNSNTATFNPPTNANLASIAEIIENGTLSGDGGGWVVTSATYAGPGSIGTSPATTTITATAALFTLALPSIAPTSTVTGSMAATESGADTFAASGTVSQPVGNVNLLAASEEIGGPSWQSSTPPVLVESDVDGTTVDELTFNTQTNWESRQTINGLTIGQAYTFSVEVQTGRTASALAVRLTTNNSSAWNTGASTKATLTGTLTRVFTTWVQQGTNTAGIILGTPAVDGSLDADAVGKVRLSKAMLNTGTTPGTYSRTPLTATGSMSATEAGSDTASSSGTVLVQGSMSATEAGPDTSAGSGSVRVTGSLSATESGTDTVAGSGTVRVTGAMSATEAGADSFAGSGTVRITGSMSATEANSDSFAGSGTVLVTGSMSATESGTDTLAGSGSVLVQGSLSATESGSDSFSGSGAVLVSGSMAATESGPDTLQAPGSILVQGWGNASESESDTFAGSGSVIVQGTLNATESGPDTLESTGAVWTSGSMSATEDGEDSFESSGTVLVQGSMDATESGSDTLSGSGSVPSGPSMVSGDAFATESGADTLASSGQILVSGDLLASETGPDGFTSSGTVRVSGSLSAQEAGSDSLTGSGSVQVRGSMAAQEAGADSLQASGEVVIAGDMAAQEEGSDNFQAQGVILGPLNAVHTPEGGGQVEGSALVEVSLAASEAPAVGGGYMPWAQPPTIRSYEGEGGGRIRGNAVVQFGRVRIVPQEIPSPLSPALPPLPRLYAFEPMGGGRVRGKAATQNSLKTGPLPVVSFYAGEGGKQVFGWADSTFIPAPEVRTIIQIERLESTIYVIPATGGAVLSGAALVAYEEGEDDWLGLTEAELLQVVEMAEELLD